MEQSGKPGGERLPPPSPETPAPFTQLRVYQLLTGMIYVLVGGLATDYHLPARYVTHVAILVLTQDRVSIENRLLEGGYQQHGIHSIPDTVCGGQRREIVLIC